MRARVAAERARALRPADPLVYLASPAYFYGSVNPVDNAARGGGVQRRGWTPRPDNVDLLGALGDAPRRAWAAGTARPALLARAAPTRPALGDVHARRLGESRCDLSGGTPRPTRRPIGGSQLAPTDPAMPSLEGAWSASGAGPPRQRPGGDFAHPARSDRSGDALQRTRSVHQDLGCGLLDQAGGNCWCSPCRRPRSTTTSANWAIVSDPALSLSGLRVPGPQALDADSARIAFAAQRPGGA